MLDKERRIGATRRGGRAPWQPALRRTMILSTKNKLVLLVAGSLILLAVGVGLFSMYSVKRTMLEEQRRSSVNTVALATFNVMDRYQILFRSKADQAVALQHNLSWLAKLITTLVHDPSERFKIMQNFPLPEGISLMRSTPAARSNSCAAIWRKTNKPLPPPRHQRPARGPHHASPRGKRPPRNLFRPVGRPGAKSSGCTERTCTFPEREGCSWPVGQHRQARRASAAAQGRQHPGAPKRIRKTTDRAFGFSVRHGLQRYPGNRAGRHEHHPLRHQPQNRQHSYRRYPQCFENTGKSC